MPTREFGPIHPRGTCKHCGNAAYDGRATSCLPGGKCAQKEGTAPRTNEPPQIVIERDEPAAAPKAKSEPKDEGSEKEQRAAKIAHSITHELNPVLVQGFAMACRPIPPSAFMTVTETRDNEGNVVDVQVSGFTPLGKQVMVKDWEAQILARSLVELETSPVGMAASAFVGPMLPVVYGLGGVGVLAYHAYTLLQLRDSLLTMHAQQMAQAQSARQHGEGDEAQEQPPGEAPHVQDLGGMHAA